MFYFGRSVSTYQSYDWSSSRPPTKLKNTYQLTPDRTFPAAKVELIIKQLLEQYLANEQYQPILCRLMSKRLSEARNNFVIMSLK